MDDSPEFRHFISFVAVAEHCSFSRAADALRIGQPNVSLQIKQLESWSGSRLFNRLHAGAHLTESGRNLLVVARQILHMLGHAKETSSRTGKGWPLRLGYSPFAHHELIAEAFNGYKEIVPGGKIIASSNGTAELVRMIEDGRLETAIVTMPLPACNLLEQKICEDRLLVCLRRDDPFASLVELPKDAVADRLRVMFRREDHPVLHDHVRSRFRRAGMKLHLTEAFSAPSEMQFLVKTSGYFGLVRDNTPLDPELVARSITDFRMNIGTAMVSNPEQQSPSIPMLGYRMMQLCMQKRQRAEKKPVGSVQIVRGGLEAVG